MIELRPIGPGKDPVARRQFARSVRAFQAANNLYQDGIIGTQTFWFMKDLIAYLRRQLEKALKANEDLRKELAKRPKPASDHRLLYGFLIGVSITTIAAILVRAI